MLITRNLSFRFCLDHKGALLSFLLAIVCSAAGASASASQKKDYWNKQRAGANCFNHRVDNAWFDAAKNRKIQFVRLTASKWDTKSRDFLIGNADNYTGIPPADLAELKRILDMAQRHGIKIVLTPLSLPGARWLQQNDDKPDHRLWQDNDFQKQSVKFWADLAAELKNHPAVVGYNIINEPAPERATKPRLNDSLTAEFSNWYQKHAKGNPADLNLFYKKVVAAIREVDKDTPIILDSGQYATVNAFDYLEPIANDKGIIYSFHQYEPASYTNIRENGGKIRYPGRIKSEEDTRDWNAGEIKHYVGRVASWAKKNEVPANRILAGEFGVNRVAPGAAQFLADNVAAFNANGWHWAFYSFREDTWEGMNYELGSKKLEQDYYDDKAKGISKTLKLGDNTVFEPLKQGLEKCSK